MEFPVFRFPELLFLALAGPHPRSLSLAHSRSPFGKLRTTLSYVDGSLGPAGAPPSPC
jgi:hypothetical protein